MTAHHRLSNFRFSSSASCNPTGTRTVDQLRLLQTIVEVAAEKNSRVIIVPVPVEVLRFLDRAAWRLAGPTGQRGKQGPNRSFRPKPASTGILTSSPRRQLCPNGTSYQLAAGARHI